MHFLEVIIPLLVAVVPTIVSILSNRNGTKKQLDELTKSFAKHSQEERRYRLYVIWNDLKSDPEKFDAIDWANIKELCIDYREDYERFPDLDGCMAQRAKILEQLADEKLSEGFKNDD